MARIYRARNAMALLFQILGLALGLYTLTALVRGEVFTASGAHGRTVTRDRTPSYYWLVISIYAVLSVALLLVF
jgi:hypothetical protein